MCRAWFSWGRRGQTPWKTHSLVPTGLQGGGRNARKNSPKSQAVLSFDGSFNMQLCCIRKSSCQFHVKAPKSSRSCRRDIGFSCCFAIASLALSRNEVSFKANHLSLFAEPIALLQSHVLRHMDARKVSKFYLEAQAGPNNGLQAGKQNRIPEIFQEQVLNALCHEQCVSS